ncbi:MAG: hypothetical protein L6R48_24680 [Planctomycetes bacterium]|nr:hypothetical protein [Planctomycetota bacterium]
MSSINPIATRPVSAYLGSTRAAATAAAGSAATARTDSYTPSPEGLQALEAALALQALGGGSAGDPFASADSGSGGTLAALLGGSGQAAAQDPVQVIQDAMLATERALLGSSAGGSSAASSDLSAFLTTYTQGLEASNAQLIQAAMERVRQQALA